MRTLKKFILPVSIPRCSTPSTCSKIVEAYEGWDGEQQRLNAEARAERKARQEALIAENDTAADLQHQDA